VFSCHGEHVHHDIWLLFAEVVASLACQTGGLVVYVLDTGRQPDFMYAAVTDRDLMIGTHEQRHQAGTAEPSPTEHQHAHV